MLDTFSMCALLCVIHLAESINCKEHFHKTSDESDYLTIAILVFSVGQLLSV